MTARAPRRLVAATLAAAVAAVVAAAAVPTAAPSTSATDDPTGVTRSHDDGANIKLTGITI